MPRTLITLLILISFHFTFSQDWNEVIRIHTDNRKNDQQFGYSVDIQGNTAVVGANGNNGSAVYVFTKQEDGTWTQVQELRGTDSKSTDLFGGSVSIDGNIIAIGASWADIKSDVQTQNDAGAAYIFEKSGGMWKQTKKLQAPDPFSEDQFGISVDISGNRLLVGALWNDYDEKGKKYRQDAGAAYYFEKTEGNWQYRQKLTPKDRKPFSLFGISISIDNKTAVIGSYREGFDSRNKEFLEFAGAAYVFELNEENDFQEVQKLSASDRTEGSFFGYSVSLKNDLIIIGAQEHQLDVHGASPLKGSGAAYIFRKKENEWLENQKITSLDRQAYGFFGESVYTDGKRCIVGACGQKLNERGINAKDTAGAVYIFEDSGNGKWVEKEKLCPEQRYKGDQFGISVAIDGEYAIGGAWGHDMGEDMDTLNWSGAAFIFSRCKKPEIEISTSNRFIVSGENVLLSAKGADKISWDKGVRNNISFRPEKTDFYIATGRNKSGCFSKAEIEVVVKQPQLDAFATKAPTTISTDAKGNSDFRIVQLDENRVLAASTREVIQKLKGLTIISNLKFNDTDEPAANVNVLLLDENGMVLKRGKTDRNGEARFEMLDPEGSYDVVIDKNDPQLDADVKKDGKDVAMAKREFIEQVSGFTLLSHIEFTESSEPASDIYVLLLDENGYVLKKGKTNENGIAYFEELDKTKNYRVIIDKNHPSVNVDVSLNGRLVKINTKRILENFERLTLLSKMSYTGSNDPASDIPVVLMDENGIVLKRGRTNAEGMAMFIVPEGMKNYRISVDEDYLATLKPANEDQYHFDNVYFDFNSSELREGAIAVLNKVAAVLRNDSSKKIIIHAHTDAIGSNDINMLLAEKRGKMVKDYLVKQGLSALQVEIDAVGAGQPVASNDQDYGRQLNRRVEFEIQN